MIVITSQANRTFSDLQPQNVQLNYVRVVVNFLLLQLLYYILREQARCTLMVLQVTLIAPEVIFVKPEVKFLSPEMALMGHLCVLML